MCGIVGFVGSDRASDHVLDGLRRLEYRGYDSAGIASLHKDDIHIRRRKGKIVHLADLLRDEPLQGDLAIGHTRWATHGRPSEENAHPHRAGDIVLVHNGIIENYLALREQLTERGCTFESETDTEIVAHLVAETPGETLVDRVRGALQKVEGAYAIATFSTREPDTIVVAKNASPLIIGIMDGAGIVASDIPALLPFTRDVIILEEGELAEIKPGAVRLFNEQGPFQRAPKRIEWSPVMAEKDGHRHFMHKEIFEQPRAITDTLRGRLSATRDDVVIEDDLREALKNASRVVLTACGTSYYASLLGRLAIEELGQLPCQADLASELRYRNAFLPPDTVVITVSQSGETADTLAAIRHLKQRGCKVLSIVNVVDSTIARESDWVMYTRAGPEIGVASTKAFVTQVTALYLIAVATGRARGATDAEQARSILDELTHVPRWVEATLEQEPKIIEVASQIAGANSALYLGRNYGYPIAMEGALKLKEISYIHAEGISAGEIKHGPIALIEPGLPVVSIATEDGLFEKNVSSLQEVRAREGKVIAVTTEGETRLDELTEATLTVPKTLPMLAPLLTCVPLQLLAYHVADHRGTDIDQPRNLAKSVTVE